MSVLLARRAFDSEGLVERGGGGGGVEGGRGEKGVSGWIMRERDVRGGISEGYQCVCAGCYHRERHHRLCYQRALIEGGVFDGPGTYIEIDSVLLEGCQRVCYRRRVDKPGLGRCF